MLSFFLMLLNGWAAWLCAITAANYKRAGVKAPWHVHPLGVANVLLCVINFMLFLEA